MAATTSRTAWTSGELNKLAEDVSGVEAIVNVGLMPALNVKTVYGAKGDYTHFSSAGTNLNDGAMTNGSATLACASTTPFTSADVGKVISVPGAGVAAATLNTTIAAFVDSGHVTLASTASATVSGQTISYGTDDTGAIQAALDAAANGGTAFNQGAIVYFPAGRYLVAGLTLSGSGVTLLGCGIGDTASGGFGAMLVGRSTMSGTTDLLLVSGVKCSVRQMALSGSSAGRDVLRIANTAQRFIGDSLYVSSAGANGISQGTSVTSVTNKWSNIYVASCVSHGIVCNSSDTEWSNITTFQNGGDGMRIVGSNASVVNLHPWGNTGAGLTLSGGAARVTDLYTETNTGNGVDITSIANKITAGRSWKNTGKGISISGSADRNEVLVDCVDNTGEGIYIQAGSFNKVLGGQFFDDQGGSKTQTYGVRVAAAATNTYVGAVTANDGDHITAGLLDESTSTTWELGANKRVLAADQTFNANTTLTDILTAAGVKAGQKYLVDGILFVDGSQAADLKARIQVTGGTAPSGYFSLDNAAAGSSASTTAVSVNPANAVTVAASAGSVAATGLVGVGTIQAIHVSGYVVVGTADASVVLQAAQSTSDATVTTIHAGSWMRLARVV
jgi:hypothetical protein